MTRSAFVSIALAAGIVAAPSVLLAEEPYALVNGPAGIVKAGLFSEKYASLPVATIEKEPITLRDLSDALAAAHGEHGDQTKGGKKDFSAVLDRIIGARLIALEAHAMGLDEQPELKEAAAVYADGQLLEALRSRISGGVKSDPKTVELYFRDTVREWKVQAVLFKKEADAKEMSAALKAGKQFAELYRGAVAAKKAEDGGPGEYVPIKKLQPQVAAAVRELFPGQASEPVKVESGWSLLLLEEIRYPVDAKAREEAEARSLDERRELALKTYYDALVKKTCTTQQKLVDKLDFEKKKPGFQRLSKDKRVVARIAGGKTLTVSDLTEAMRVTFYHGVEESIRLKRVNEAKIPTLNKLIYHEVFDAEAKRLKIADTDEYKRAVAEYKESLVFGAFVKKAVLPGLQVTEDEGKKYFEQHRAEFTLPAFYKLSSLAFTKPKDAQRAFDKLKSGTDFNWLKANADGQVAEDKRTVDFNGVTVSANALPSELVAKLKGARPGDYRLQALDGQNLLIKVITATPEEPQPYLQVRPAIGKKLAAELLTRAMADWVAKLRKAHDVKVYLSQIGS